MLKTFFIGLIILTQTAAQSSVLHWLTQPTEPMPLIANNDASSGYYNDYKISTNGRYITFISQATNLVESDHNGAEDLFMHDAVTGITKRVNTTNNGSELETGIRQQWSNTGRSGHRRSIVGFLKKSQHRNRTKHQRLWHGCVFFCELAHAPVW